MDDRVRKAIARAVLEIHAAQSRDNACINVLEGEVAIRGTAPYLLRTDADNGELVIHVKGNAFHGLDRHSNGAFAGTVAPPAVEFYDCDVKETVQYTF